MDIPVNAYLVEDDQVYWKHPVAVIVRPLIDQFCIVQIGEQSVLVDGNEMATAVKVSSDI